MNTPLTLNTLLGITLSLALTIGSIAQPARAAVFSPSTGVKYNNVASNTEDQYKIVRHLTQSIDSAPAGSTIRMALYSGGVASFTESVINAHKRGVNLRLIVDGHSSQTEWWKKFVAELGTDISKTSFATVCRVSCFDTRDTSYQHAKFYTFSQSGESKSVVMVGSGNPSVGQASSGWNNLYTVVGNYGMYKAYYQYFDAMAQSSKIEDNVNYYRSVTSGEYTTVLSPAQKSTDDDYYGRVLNNISCTAGAGYGYNGKTTVRVIMGLWTSSRIDNAKKLVELDDKGCGVEVIISAHGISRDVQDTLLKPTANGGIVVRNASKDTDGNGKVDRYTHEKTVAVSGGYNGQQVKTVWFGSHNFTYNAFRGNNDVILKVADAAIFDTHTNHFVFMKNYAPVMRKSIATSRTAPGESRYIGMTAAETNPVGDIEVLSELSE